MDIQIFEHFNANFWLLIALLILVAELLFIGSVYLLPIAVGFTVAQLVRWTGFNLELQLVAIAVSSLFGLYLWRKLYRKTSPEIAEEQSLDIGQTIQILEWPEDGANARVQYRGAAWLARLSEKSSKRLPGVYRIVGVQGPALIVELV